MSDGTLRGLYYSNADDSEDGQTIRRRENNRQIRNIISCIFLLASVLVLGLKSEEIGLGKIEIASRVTGDVFTDTNIEIDTSREPVQISYTGDSIKKNISGIDITIVPQAKYEIYAVMQSSWSFSNSTADPDDNSYAKIAPIDLCLSWGKLAEPDYDKNMIYNHGRRRCYFRPIAEMPLENSYIGTHASNNHIIPATDSVLSAVKSIKPKEKVALKGFLVNVMVKSNDQEFMALKTSLTRKDEDDGACEVFYVTKVRTGDRIYE